MNILLFFVQLGFLWFLISLFTESSNPGQSLRETWIVIFGTAIINVLGQLLLGSILGPFAGLIAVVALYFLVLKVCGTDRRSALNICGWFFGILVVLDLGFLLITHI
jgi:hypothetical protein